MDMNHIKLTSTNMGRNIHVIPSSSKVSFGLADIGQRWCDKNTTVNTVQQASSVFCFPNVHDIFFL
jgi:hypothetical protein